MQIKNNLKACLIVFFLLLFYGTTVYSQDKRPVTFDDLMALRDINARNAMSISPDGSAVLFTVSKWEAPGRDSSGKAERRERSSHIWLAQIDSGVGEARQLTFGESGESRPGWSPDGSLISYISSPPRTGGNKGRAQIWLMSTDGGEEWKLTDMKEGVSSYAWSPDSKGQQIAFVTQDPLPKEVEERLKRGGNPRILERGSRSSHVWIVDVESKQVTKLTNGKDFVALGQFTWAPDGKRLAFLANPTGMYRDDRVDIYVLTIESKSLEKITKNPGPDRMPAWSPDGTTIAFISTTNTSKPGPDGILPAMVAHAHLALFDVASKRLRDVSSPQFDLDPRLPTWTSDSKRVLLTIVNRTYKNVFVYDIAANRYSQLTKGKVINAMSLSKDGSLVAFVMNSPVAPADVYVSNPAFTSLRKLTTMNPQVAELELGETEVITWKSSDGLEIESLLLKPINFQSGKRYPLLVNIHGGPGGTHQNIFRVNSKDAGQRWASQGWAVLYPNPRGSRAYGEKFLQGNIPDWGGGDYRDIMAGVDAVIKRGIADPERLAVMGWSYGGYMTTWIIGQTNRFKAALAGATITNIVSMYGTTDHPNYLAAFFEGPPSKKTMPLYVERSPISYADHVTTPVLILHGANDDRCPIGQPMEFYRALNDRGKTVELGFYPREGHSIGRWEYAHQLDHLRREYEWITRYTLGESGKKITNQ